MKTFSCSFITLLIFPCQILLAQCPQNVVTNGSFNGTIGVNQPANGWFDSDGSSGLDSPDLNDVNIVMPTTGFTYVSQPIASSDGGTWQNIYFNESVIQTITLIPGTVYDVSFEYATQPIQTAVFPINVSARINLLLNG
ncbi:MAG: hypothetical protein AAFU67_07410, partial [Bacteroidota bacterium]